MKKNISKELLKRQKVDHERGLRVVKYIDCPFILSDSPVELVEGYIVSDRETCEVFASFIFKSVSDRAIKKLNIRLDCYQNQNIPYLNIDFTYSADELTFGIINQNGDDLKLKDSNKRRFIQQSETFGSCVFIPIPESYFKKLEVVITSVEYVNGDIEELDLLIAGNGKRYSDLDNMSKLVYSRLNIYVSAEEKFPTKVVPQFGTKVWLCCCGTKNPIDKAECENCGREKEWQKASVSDSALEESKQKMIADPGERVLHDKSKFSQNKYLENDAEIQKKIEQYEKAMENIALEEKRKEHNIVMILPKILIWIVSIYLIASLIELFVTGGGILGTIVSFIKQIFNMFFGI